MVHLFILIFATIPHHKADGDFGGLVKPAVVGNEPVLRNCSSSENEIITKCYIEMFNSYGKNYTQLPKSSSDPFSNIRYDATDMCNKYNQLQQCNSNVNNNCLNFNTFNTIFDSEVDDAAYYVAQTAFMEFYCNYGYDFVLYYDCMQIIDLDDLSQTIFTECSLLEVGTCDSVSKTVQCERAVVRKSCISKDSIKSYCQYQKILTEMTGWNQCEYMPCVNSNNQVSLFFLFIFYLIS